MMKGILFLALVAALFPSAASAADVDLDELRGIVEKYKDVKVALAEGYITPDNHCVFGRG
jgi:opacity protein-like surface antigen